MTATDELRKLLDERGVEYMEDHGYREFFWDFGESGRARASAIGTKGLVQMIVTGITPAQAIEATLGHGTCHEVIVDEYWRGCGNCGYVWEYMYGIGKCTRPNFCPRCGAKVVGA